MATAIKELTDLPQKYPTWATALVRAYAERNDLRPLATGHRTVFARYGPTRGALWHEQGGAQRAASSRGPSTDPSERPVQHRTRGERP